MPLDHDRLLAAIDTGRERSYGTDETSGLGAQRAAALGAYFGLNSSPAPEGRSQVVDRSVFETVSTLLPSLVRIFGSTNDAVCKLTPVGPEDEAAAEQASAVINHVATQQNPWEQVFGDWLLDAMLLSNGYAMVYWDERDSVVRERYEGQSDDQVAALMSDPAVRVLQHSQSVDEQATAEAQQAWQQQAQRAQMMLQQWQVAAAQAQQRGMRPPPQPPAPPPQPQQVLQHELVIERREREGSVAIRVLPPEDVYVSADTPSWTLDDCPYFEYRREVSLGELRSMGLEVADDVNDDEDADSDEADVRNRYGEDLSAAADLDGASRRVWCRTIWVRADIEGDSIERMYYVLAVGRTILYVEPAARVMVSSMTCIPLPHRHVGMSVAETVMDVQDIKTAVTRGGLDNLYLANAARSVVSSRVNLQDMLDARPGGIVRMLDDSLPAEGHILPLTHPVVFDQVIGSLEYFDQVRQNRTGASRYFSGTDPSALNKTASGTIALQNMASMRVEHLARVIAPAVEKLFELVLECLSRHRSKALAMKLRGDWVVVDPQAWRTKRDVRISVGVGAGNKDAMMQQLSGVLQAQMQIGLPLGLVTRDNIQATNEEILKLAGFANPEKFWPDPRRLPPPQPPMSPEIMKIQADQQAQQFKAQQEQMRFQAEQQVEAQKMQLQAAVDKQREEMQARQKALEAEQQAQLERIRLEYQAAADAKKLEFEQWRASLDAAVKLDIAAQGVPKPDTRIDELVATIQALREESDSPAELVRGPDGKAVAVKRGQRVRQVVRGPDGRAIGLQ